MPFDVGTITWEPRPSAAAPGAGVPRGTASSFAMRPAQGESWALGPFSLTRFDSAPTAMRRGADQAQRDLLDDWMVCVGAGPLKCLPGNGSRMTVSAGTPLALALSAAFSAECGEAGCLALLVPRHGLPECCAALDRDGHQPLDSAPGRLLGGFLLRLAAGLPSMVAAERSRAVDAMRALIAAAVPAGAAPNRADDAAVLAVRLARVKAIIRQHLRSPELSPEWLCGVTGMSRSQLYRLFEPTGGVRREIQRERLRQAHRAIADTAEMRSIYQIGEEIGFVEPTAFSRAFRREFGYAPSTLRRAPAPLPAMC